MRPIKRLKLERKRLGASQQGLEALSGVSQPVISLAETGRLVPTDAQLERLATALNTPAEDLLQDVVEVRR